jgi:hypothetical protein
MLSHDLADAVEFLHYFGPVFLVRVFRRIAQFVGLAHRLLRIVQDAFRHDLVVVHALAQALVGVGVGVEGGAAVVVEFLNLLLDGVHPVLQRRQPDLGQRVSILNIPVHGVVPRHADIGVPDKLSLKCSSRQRHPPP